MLEKENGKRSSLKKKMRNTVLKMRNTRLTAAAEKGSKSAQGWLDSAPKQFNRFDS
ncbi:hypothetical protein CISIN_1g0469171mg, partial [Citrus sinensis]